MMRDYLETQIASRRRRLETLDRERAALVGELAAYEDTLARSIGGSDDLTNLQTAKSQASLPISRAWFVVLEGMSDFRYFNAEDLALTARELHNAGKLTKPLTKDGIRAQLSLYTKKGILRRRGGGQYLFTEEARAALASTPKTSLGQSS